MNHSGDTNKMVGDTPRTDEQINGKPCTRFEILVGDSLRDALIPSQFARQLERELSAANQRIKQLEDARTVAAANSLANMLAYEDAVAKIKRLEEAGDALFELCDASPIQFELVDQIPQRLKAWEETKEAKP